MSQFGIEDIVHAQRRIKPFVNPTPVVSSSLLNRWLGHEVYFKAECLQKIGAFKMRGATNFLAKRQEEGCLPQQVVANSSGNHAQAVACAAAAFNIPATIYASENISTVKAAATEYYGATVLKFADRKLADAEVLRASEADGVTWIPPFNHYDIMAGQGTAAFEALTQLGEVDGVFAPCGGGGLISGTLVAARALSPKAEVVGNEPLAANDAAKSIRAGTIQALPQSPVTIADGAATMSVGDLTFPFLQQLDAFYEIEEERIIYWTQWLQHILKLHIEPTSAMSMEGVVRWLSAKTSPQKVLVILSGGNISTNTSQKIWKEDYLTELPALI